jgi:hydroxyacylglutathione hydrolase
MLLKYFYDEKLAHASYLVGCQKEGVAIVIDPGRYIEQYIEFAKKEGMEVIAAAETHIHADFLSGSRELPIFIMQIYMYLMKEIVIGNINILMKVDTNWLERAQSLK